MIDKNIRISVNYNFLYFSSQTVVDKTKKFGDSGCFTEKFHAVDFGPKSVRFIDGKNPGKNPHLIKK